MKFLERWNHDQLISGDLDCDADTEIFTTPG